MIVVNLDVIEIVSTNTLRRDGDPSEVISLYLGCFEREEVGLDLVRKIQLLLNGDQLFLLLVKTRRFDDLRRLPPGSTKVVGLQ